MVTKVRIEDDAELAARLATTAGQIACAVRDSGLLDGKELGSAGDKVANAFLMKALAEQRPEDGVLSEESRDTLERLDKDRVWIVDPVDGTREYGERRGDWAVHVGLSIGGRAAVGAVALPGLNVTMRSDRTEHLPPAPQRLRMVVSRTRPAKEAVQVAEALDAELVPMGSAGAKAMAILRGEADIYLHSGGQYEWDNCAPAAVCDAFGLHCSRIDGAPLRYNRADVALPDLLFCRKEHATRVLNLVAAM
ncbi:3'(2'),5'-bisphosphate nucleotidase CysQ [Croceicoccus hydrothermalis]|uniref:3'(2'),5'-bisphosphate nucleotidase CysQ n=1 Tax=Croceicoccus hydrothermalis TaxID=2867964 RepID=UPI001EFBD5BA|nr:3'(2'),5'-bisphosphate nucleotidase CysQ [Croceicoccus hydrothermalis]